MFGEGASDGQLGDLGVVERQRGLAVCLRSKGSAAQGLQRLCTYVLQRLCSRPDGAPTPPTPQHCCPPEQAPSSSTRCWSSRRRRWAQAR